MYWNLTDKERLIKAIKTANTPDLLKDFLDDLLTEKEIELLTKRLRVACLLFECVPYSQIQKFTGLNPNSITRISKKLKNKQGGFRVILRKMNPNGKSYFD